MKIVALDSSTKSTGYAVYDEDKLIDYGCLTSSSKDLVVRLKEMYNKIKVVLGAAAADKLILEEVRPEDSEKNIKTHKALMYLQGVIVILAHDHFPNIEIEFIYPSEWRSACGIKTGRGIKRETLKKRDVEFVEKEFGIKANDDVCDAIGIGYGYLKEREGKFGLINFE